MRRRRARRPAPVRWSAASGSPGGVRPAAPSLQQERARARDAPAWPRRTCGGVSAIVSSRNGVDTRARAANVVSRSTNSAAVCRATGASSAVRSVSARTNRSRPGALIGQVAHDGLEIAEQRSEFVERDVQVDAAAGESGAEPVQRSLDARPHGRPEGVQQLVDLDDARPRLADRQRAAVGHPAVGRARRHVDVLAAERARDPDRHGRVRGIGSYCLSIRSSRTAIGAPSGPVAGFTFVTWPDAVAADVHVGALGDLAAVRYLDEDLVARYEREAVDRVVGR